MNPEGSSRSRPVGSLNKLWGGGRLREEVLCGTEVRDNHLVTIFKTKIKNSNNKITLELEHIFQNSAQWTHLIPFPLKFNRV